MIPLRTLPSSGGVAPTTRVESESGSESESESVAETEPETEPESESVAETESENARVSDAEKIPATELP